MRRNLALLALALLVPAGAAHACGRRCAGCHHHRMAARGRHVVQPACAYAYAAPPMTYAPAMYARAATPMTYAPPMTAAATPMNHAPAMTAAATPVPAATPGVAPSYAYPTQPGEGVAYYYTYDESGKLIIQQWADFLFRGGKQAGMPRPPLPIVGYLQRR